MVLDTLNRSLSGSESSDKDMTLYVKAAEAVRKAFGCLCVIVHHCGYDDTHARGHTSLPAAVDAELSVMRDEGSPIVPVTVKAMRDGPEGMVVRSRALPVPLDPDQNGKPRSSIVIIPDDDETLLFRKKGGRPDTATPLFWRCCGRRSTRRVNTSPLTANSPCRPLTVSTCGSFSTAAMSTPRKMRQNLRARRIRRTRGGWRGAIGKKIVNGQKDDHGRQLLWFVRDEGEAAMKLSCPKRHRFRALKNHP